MKSRPMRTRAFSGKVGFRFSEENATTQRNLERVSAQDRVNVSGTRRHALVPTLLAAGVTAPVLDEHQKPMRRGASTAKLTAASNCRPRRCSSAWGTPRSPSRWTCTATCSRAATTEPSWRRRKWRCWRSYSRVVRPEQDLLSARRDHPPVRPRLCRRQCSHMRTSRGNSTCCRPRSAASPSLERTTGGQRRIGRRSWQN